MSYTCSLNNRETELTSEMDKVKLAASKLLIHMNSACKSICMFND